MQELAQDQGVFVRSLASRGAGGGLAEAAADVVAVLDAAGYSIVLVETVGAGQDEVEVAYLAHTTVMVMSPGTGDSIQALKAGLLEMAHILVVNKADLPGADGVATDLKEATTPGGSWQVPVLKTVASQGQGVSAVAEAVGSHRRYMRETEDGRQRETKRVRRWLVVQAQRRLQARLVAAPSLDELAEAVTQGHLDPHSAVDRLIAEAT